MDLKLIAIIILFVIGVVLYTMSNPIVTKHIDSLKNNDEYINDMYPVYWIMCSIISVIFMGFALVCALSYFFIG